VKLETVLNTDVQSGLICRDRLIGSARNANRGSGQGAASPSVRNGSSIEPFVMIDVDDCRGSHQVVA
jgi:hypothetical protein